MADKTHDVYLSSTLRDLQETRDDIDRFFKSAEWTVKQSYSTDPTQPVVASCLADVRASRLYVGVIGWRYGSEADHPVSGEFKSITEHEFDAAGEAGIPRHVYLMDSSAPTTADDVDKDRSKIDAFRARISGCVRPVLFQDVARLLSLLPSVFKGSVSGSAAPGSARPDLLPRLPAALDLRRPAIDIAFAACLHKLEASLPRAGGVLRAELAQVADDDDHSAVSRLNNLTRALESEAIKAAFHSLKTDDRARFQQSLSLLIRLCICRCYSAEGWQRLRDLTGAQLLQTADIRLLHIGAQAARGLDFDLPPASTEPAYSRHLHHLDPDLDSGLGRNRRQSIIDEAVRNFDFAPARPADEQGQAALDLWEQKLAAFLRNRCKIERRRYAVAQPVSDVAGADLLAEAARAIDVLPMAYSASLADSYLAEPALDLIDALNQCVVSLHALHLPQVPAP